VVTDRYEKNAFSSKHEERSMSTWVGISPVIGAGSLDGFAIGAMMSGTFFLAITAPRRAQRRQLAAARAGGALATGPRAWLREHLTAAPATRTVTSPDEAAGSESPSPVVPAQDASGPDDEQVTQPDGPVVGDDAPKTSRDGKAAGGYRSRHRLGDPIAGGTPPAESSPAAARRRRAIPESAFLGRIFPGSAFLAEPGDEAQSDDQGPDIEFPDGTLAASKHPESRRLPRHAAPTVSLSSKLSHKVTGLFAARPLASGARG
jgi:hypothetical protein